MSTFSLPAGSVRTLKSRTGKRDKPRDGVGGPNGVANNHFGLQRVAARGDRKHKTHGEWGHRGRQFVGCGDLVGEKSTAMSFIKFRPGVGSEGSLRTLVRTPAARSASTRLWR